MMWTVVRGYRRCWVPGEQKWIRNLQPCLLMMLIRLFDFIPTLIRPDLPPLVRIRTDPDPHHCLLRLLMILSRLYYAHVLPRFNSNWSRKAWLHCNFYHYTTTWSLTWHWLNHSLFTGTRARNRNTHRRCSCQKSLLQETRPFKSKYLVVKDWL